jgi:hypothetical protein
MKTLIIKIFPQQLCVFFSLMLFSIFLSCNSIVGERPDQFNFILDSASVNVTQNYKNLSILFEENGQFQTVSDVKFERIEISQGKFLNIFKAYRVFSVAVSSKVTRFELRDKNTLLGVFTLNIEPEKTKFNGYRIKSVYFNEKQSNVLSEISEYSYIFRLD